MFQNGKLTSHICCGILLSLLSGSITVRAASMIDPTRPLHSEAIVVAGTVTEEIEEPVLGSVLTRPGGRLAIINDRRYSENDRFGDFEVHKIKASSVILRRGSETLELRLASRSIKGL